MHGERYISHRERVAHCVGPNDGDANVSPATRVHVDPDHFDSELAANLVSNLTRCAPDIEYTGHGEHIPSNGANHQSRVAEKPVNTGQLLVRTAGLVT
jgi:hypothetical protein